MSGIIRDILHANRAAVTKLIPRARRLAHTHCNTVAERRAQLREMAECLYLADRAERAGAIGWQWLSEHEDADFGDCEPMADGTYDHDRLCLVSCDGSGTKVETLDSLGCIIVPLSRAARTRGEYQDELAVANRDAIYAAWLALEGAPSDPE